MWRVVIPIFAVTVAASAFSAHGAEEKSQSAEIRKDGCKVVERKGSSDNSGTMTSSVTAGGGKVSGYTTGGNSVTVHSGGGSSSSFAAAGSSGGSTVVAGSGSGDCTIYVDPGKK